MFAAGAVLLVGRAEKGAALASVGSVHVSSTCYGVWRKLISKQSLRNDCENFSAAAPVVSHSINLIDEPFPFD